MKREHAILTNSISEIIIFLPFCFLEGYCPEAIHTLSDTSLNVLQYKETFQFVLRICHSYSVNKPRYDEAG